GTIASAAPLLGLLGTLIGMIEIFGASGVGDGGSANPAALAHGISVALYNTAFGLIVAIPALICHRHFRTRIDGYTMDMEEAAERLLQHLMRLPGKRNGG
ncbi:MAG: biopolymer transport protein ExbB, partial [Pseudomonadota bacterium]|nr:biopolymer transport protein ExbB [Pseudomonadota bacterium]